MVRGVSAEVGSLSFVLHPFNATPAYVDLHQGLVRQLEQKLHRRLHLTVSSDFDAYFDGLMTGQFDITICPPHFAMMSIQKGIYAPVLMFKRPIEPVLVVRKDSRYEKLADLFHTRIAMADRLAFMPIALVKLLSDRGLTAEKDYHIVERPTHLAAIQHVVRGEADAALAGPFVVRTLAPELSQQVRVIPIRQQLPNQFVLINRKLGNTVAGTLKGALRDFSVDSTDGKVFFDKTGLGGFDEISGDTINLLQSYVQTTRAMLMLIP